MVMWSV